MDAAPSAWFRRDRGALPEPAGGSLHLERRTLYGADHEARPRSVPWTRPTGSARGAPCRVGRLAWPYTPGLIAIAIRVIRIPAAIVRVRIGVTVRRVTVRV